MNAISLFNGMGTLRQAFHDMNIKVNKYYSSEIKPYAIELQQHHFPDVIQVGDITKWKEWDIDWSKIDFIGSGSPCQDLSIAGNRAGINGNKSSLFWIFIEILNHVKSLNPNVLFLQENVGSASKLDVGIMSRALGVYPVRINSKLLTAQLRDRYYWTNIRTKQNGLFGDIISDIPQPKDKNIMFKDVLVDDINDNYIEFPEIVYLDGDVLKVKTNTVKGFDVITENDCLNLAFISSETRRGRVTKGKSPCLLQGNEPLYTWNGATLRTLSKIELCRLQGFPDNYCDILTRNKAASLLGDGWTLPVIIHILSFMEIN